MPKYTQFEDVCLLANMMLNQRDEIEEELNKRIVELEKKTRNYPNNSAGYQSARGCRKQSAKSFVQTVKQKLRVRTRLNCMSAIFVARILLNISCHATVMFRTFQLHRMF